MPIRKIEIDGPFRFEHVIPGLYFAIRHRWRAEFGIELPQYDELPRFGRVKDLRILLEPVTLTVTYENSRWVQFRFARGWISDLASVPWFFRSVVDNDDSLLLPAAMMHDYLFSTHRLSFRESNALLRDAAGVLGYSPALATLAWIAVSSPTGKRKWKENAIKRCDWTEKTAMYLQPR